MVIFGKEKRKLDIYIKSMIHRRVVELSNLDAICEVLEVLLKEDLIP